MRVLVHNDSRWSLQILLIKSHRKPLNLVCNSESFLTPVDGEEYKFDHVIHLLDKHRIRKFYPILLSIIVYHIGICYQIQLMLCS